jgi:hypothetical protein
VHTRDMDVVTGFGAGLTIFLGSLLFTFAYTELQW